MVDIYSQTIARELLDALGDDLLEILDGLVLHAVEVVREARDDRVDVLYDVLEVGMIAELQVDVLVIEQRVDEVGIVVQIVRQAAVDYLEKHAHQLVNYCQVL